MKNFDICVYYNEDSYGKAYTTIQAETQEDAIAKLAKAELDGTIWHMDWDCYAKGGAGMEFAWDVPVAITSHDTDTDEILMDPILDAAAKITKPTFPRRTD